MPFHDIPQASDFVLFYICMDDHGWSWMYTTQYHDILLYSMAKLLFVERFYLTTVLQAAEVIALLEEELSVTNFRDALHKMQAK